MIVSALGLDPALLGAFLCWSVVCWIAGVGFAAYRALSWADRIRLWAHTTTIETEEPCSSSSPSSALS